MQNRAGQEAMKSCDFRIQIQPDPTGRSGMFEFNRGIVPPKKELARPPEVVVVVKLYFLGTSARDIFLKPRAILWRRGKTEAIRCQHPQMKDGWKSLVMGIWIGQNSIYNRL